MGASQRELVFHEWFGGFHCPDFSLLFPVSRGIRRGSYARLRGCYAHLFLIARNFVGMYLSAARCEDVINTVSVLKALSSTDDCREAGCEQHNTNACNVYYVRTSTTL